MQCNRAKAAVRELVPATAGEVFPLEEGDVRVLTTSRSAMGACFFYGFAILNWGEQSSKHKQSLVCVRASVGARPICPLQTCSWWLLGSGCYGIDRGLVDDLQQMSAHLLPGPPKPASESGYQASYSSVHLEEGGRPTDLAVPVPAILPQRGGMRDGRVLSTATPFTRWRPTTAATTRPMQG